VSSWVSVSLLPSTRKTLTDWSKSYRGQNYGWGLEHIMDKGRQRDLSYWEIPQSRTLEEGPRPVGGISVNGDFQY